MIALGPVLIVFGIGFFGWLLFTFAVYALPCFAGITTGLAAFHSAAGVIGGFAVGFFAGAATLYAGQFAYAAALSPSIRATIALLFAFPATLAGYHTTLGLAQFGVPSEGWRQIFAIVGAAAWTRIFDAGPFAAGDDAVTSRGHFR